MTAKLQAIATSEPCHLILGGMKWPKPCHQEAPQDEDANRA